MEVATRHSVLTLKDQLAEDARIFGRCWVRAANEAHRFEAIAPMLPEMYAGPRRTHLREAARDALNHFIKAVRRAEKAGMKARDCDAMMLEYQAMITATKGGKEC